MGPALLLVCAGSPAAELQAQAWNLPARGAVFYKRVRTSDPASLGGHAGFPIVEMPAVLFHGDLDPKHQHPAKGATDLRDLGAWLAFDLRKARSPGKLKVSLDTLLKLGSVEITGKVLALEDNGEQTIQVTFRTKKAPTMPYSANVEGTIQIRRTVDLEKGVVTEFTSELSAKFEPAGLPPAPSAIKKCEIKDRWTLHRIERNREPRFKTKVADTIRRGAEYIKSQLAEAGKPGQAALMTMGVDCCSGELALCLLTLVKAEVDRKDPALVAGFDRLRKRVISDTYSLGVALMAMEALYAPTGERQALIEGRIKAPKKRKVPAGDLALMKEWTNKLLGNETVPRAGDVLRFNYSAGKDRYDNSNTQYALLGLYSAHLCGVKIETRVWTDSARHWISDQIPDGKRSLRLHITSHTDYAEVLEAERLAALEAGAAKGKGQARTAAARRGGRRTGRGVKAAGWSYLGRNDTSLQPEPATGSMTTAGLTGVTICEAVLRNQKKGRDLLSKLAAARQSGLAWILRNFSVRANVHNSVGWYYYYMYGLERVFELSQIALISGRDWYFEGATLLIEMGGEHPSLLFSNAGLRGTCFGVLFLKLASPPLPVITGRR